MVMLPDMGSLAIMSLLRTLRTSSPLEEPPYMSLVNAIPFLKTLSGLFKPAPVFPNKGLLKNVDIDEEDIPRYPPFAKGLPVAPVDRVLATQVELVERIRMSLGFKQKDFDLLVRPVIERYASFVHLLPASEAHHHRGAGGLFRHGLEVAFWSAQASEGVIFSSEGTPKERRDNEPRWRLASCFSGLLHDVGKPLSDVSITDRNGKLIWNPYGDSLYEWARKNNVDRYFIRWRDKRHKRHEQFSLLTVDRILPDATRGFLSENGPKIMEAMLEAISGTGVNQPVTKLMLMADRESVSRDLKQSRLNVDEFAYGVPVERYVFDAVRRLIKTGVWKVNEVGGKVWHLKQGVFIVWKPVQDICDLVDKDKIPGVPRDADTLAEILVERGFAISNTVMESGGKATYRYWEVLPDIVKEKGVTKPLMMLRLESPDLIFTTEPPVAIEGLVVGDVVAVDDHSSSVVLSNLDGSAPAEEPTATLAPWEATPLPVPPVHVAQAQAPQSAVGDEWKDMRMPPAKMEANATTAPASAAAVPVAPAVAAALAFAPVAINGAGDVELEINAEILSAEQDAMASLAMVGMEGLSMFGLSMDGVMPTVTSNHKDTAPANIDLEASTTPKQLPADMPAALAPVVVAPGTAQPSVSLTTESAIQKSAHHSVSADGVITLGKSKGAASASPATVMVLDGNQKSKKKRASQGAKGSISKAAQPTASLAPPIPSPQANVSPEQSAGVNAHELLLTGKSNPIQPRANTPTAQTIPKGTSHRPAGNVTAEQTQAFDGFSAEDMEALLSDQISPLEQLKSLNMGLGFDPVAPQAYIAACAGHVDDQEVDVPLQKLELALQAFAPGIRDMLNSLIQPVLQREAMLGEAILLHEGRALILYPQGMAKLGPDPLAIVKELFDGKAIIENHASPGRKVFDFDGFKGVVLADALATALRAALDYVAEQEFDESLDSEDVAPAPALATADKPQQITHPKIAPVMAPLENECQFDPLPTKRAIKQFLDGRTKSSESKGKKLSNRSNKPVEVLDEKQSPLFIPATTDIVDSQNSSIEKDVIQPFKMVNQFLKDKENDLKIDEKASIDTNESTEEVSTDATENAIKRLINQIISGDGKWLASVPIRNGQSYEVDKRTLQLMTDELVGVELMAVHFKMRNYGLKVKENKLIYTGD